VVACEADDLVQEILISAIEKQRDWNDSSFLPWARGAIRNRARFVARTAARRHRRDHRYSVEHRSDPERIPILPEAFIGRLPPSRRVVARLINLGMNRNEIAYLLRLSDAALRKRISSVRQAFAIFTGEAEDERPDPPRADGLARRALKASLPSHARPVFGIRDPDGLPIFCAARGHM
jgi:RNA polymerase sigma-70 factor (ECF subfamily)